MIDVFQMDDPGDEEYSRSSRRRARRDHERARMRQRQRRQRSFIITVLALAIIAVVAWVTVPIVKRSFDSIGSSGVTDYEGQGEGQVTIEIPPGASGGEMGQILANAGVVANADVFITAFTNNPDATSIQPGNYNLPQKISGTRAVQLLLDPAARADVLITIPEGFTLDQVYDRFAAKLNMTREAVEKAAASASLPDQAGGKLEGWLAPGQYPVAPDANLTEIFNQMIARTTASLEGLNVDKAKWHEVLTVGSIVEHEVNIDQYYGQVARVIYNRLSDAKPTNGLLQMDSTVLYGLGKRGGIPTAAEKESDTPYNTYKHAGLPPTPIGAVGEKALKAAAQPPAGPWVYFVTVNLDSGETKFAETLDEHNRNVAELRQWQKDHPDN